MSSCISVACTILIRTCSVRSTFVPLHCAGSHAHKLRCTLTHALGAIAISCVLTGEFDLADSSCCGNTGSDDPAHGELKKRKVSRLLLQDTSLPVSHTGASASRHLLAGCPAPGNNNPDANTLITVSRSAVPASGQCLCCYLHQSQDATSTCFSAYTGSSIVLKETHAGRSPACVSQVHMHGVRNFHNMCQVWHALTNVLSRSG